MNCLQQGAMRAARDRERAQLRPPCHRAWLQATFFVIATGLAFSQESTPRSSGEMQQIPITTRRLPGKSAETKAIFFAEVRDSRGRPVPAARLELSGIQNPSPTCPAEACSSDVEGLIRIRNIPAGSYDLVLAKEGYEPYHFARVTLSGAAITMLRVTLSQINSQAAESKGPDGVPGTKSVPAAEPPTVYPGLRQSAPAIEPPAIEAIPPDSANFAGEPNRWTIALPDWRRYENEGATPYVKGHWYDPYNRNKFKGDYPIFGQRWFLNFTGTSDTEFDGRRLPVPSNVAAENAGSCGFFGRGEQAFVSETIRLSLDLSRGDTSFRPADFRFRITPAFNLNFLHTRERGLVNVDVRRGNNRLDDYVGFQEAFAEARLFDLSSHYDFVSVRAGIQQFSSDFRGFIFAEEQPGVRLFGNLLNNRLNYNVAYFHLLEKNTNSGLNTVFKNRQQQVYVANLYIQDFFAKGYTTEFSFHFNQDDGKVHFDDNGFLVRPAPVGLVVNGAVNTHSIAAYYLGWASNGHIGRVNVSHAFYQVLGHDDFNTIAGRRVKINAQMAALELSVDKDWMRFRTSFLYASGDSANRSGTSRTDATAHGFDTIVDDTHFAGSNFSFFNREGIRLTGTGVGLVQPFSLLPSLRTNKEEGQANFVNPGVYLANVGADFDVTPKTRLFVNANYLRFVRTEPLEILLFQRPIRHGIGTDASIGFEYRPPLSENIVITAGAATLIPDKGLQQIYDKKTLFALFTGIRFQF